MADAATQRSILVDALQAALAMTEPDLTQLTYRWIDDDWKLDPLSWTRQGQDAQHSPTVEGTSVSTGGDTRTPRNDQPTYQSKADQEAALATSFEQQCMVCIGLSEPDED